MQTALEASSPFSPHVHECVSQTFSLRHEKLLHLLHRLPDCIQTIVSSDGCGLIERLLIG